MRSGWLKNKSQDRKPEDFSTDGGSCRRVRFLGLMGFPVPCRRRSPRTSMNGYRLDTWLPIASQLPLTISDDQNGLVTLNCCLLNGAVQEFRWSQVTCLVSNEIHLVHMINQFLQQWNLVTYLDNHMVNTKGWNVDITFHDWNLGIGDSSPAKLGRFSSSLKLTILNPHKFLVVDKAHRKTGWLATHFFLKIHPAILGVSWSN